jgi:hypothetical protein
MTRRLAVTATVALALAVGLPAASAGPGALQIRDSENDAEQVVEVLARTTEGTIDIVSASVREEATRTVTRRTALTRDLRVDLRLAFYPSHTKGMVYRVSGAAPGLCGRADNRVTFETVMTENGPRSHLTTLCGSTPIPLQAEIGGNGISWYVPASAFPMAVVRGSRLTQVRADTGWVQHYFDHAGLVRGYGAYEQGDQAGGQADFVLR